MKRSAIPPRLQHTNNLLKLNFLQIWKRRGRSRGKEPIDFYFLFLSLPFAFILSWSWIVCFLVASCIDDSILLWLHFLEKYYKARAKRIRCFSYQLKLTANSVFSFNNESMTWVPLETESIMCFLKPYNLCTSASCRYVYVQLKKLSNMAYFSRLQNICDGGSAVQKMKTWFSFLK